MVYCFTLRLFFRLGNESYSKGSEGKSINHYGNFLFQCINTFSDFIIHHLFYPIYKGNRVVWWYVYLCKICSLPCELRVSELHNHHKQMQRTQLPTWFVLWIIQGIRLPLCGCDKWFDKWLCLNHVQLHKPLWKIPTWPFCQWVQGRQGGSCMPCTSTISFSQWKWDSQHVSLATANAHSRLLSVII